MNTIGHFIHVCNGNLWALDHLSNALTVMPHFKFSWQGCPLGVKYLDAYVGERSLCLVWVSEKRAVMLYVVGALQGVVYYYSAPDWRAEYCDARVYMRISGTAAPNFIFLCSPSYRGIKRCGPSIHLSVPSVHLGQLGAQWLGQATRAVGTADLATR